MNSLSSLNPPVASMQGQNQLFNNISSPNNQDSSSTHSLSCLTLFNILDRRQALELGELRVKDIQQQDHEVLHEGSSTNYNNHQVMNNSSLISSPQPVMEDNDPSNTCDHNLPLIYKLGNKQQDSKNISHGSEKWMPSKVRLMKKMMMRPTSSSSSVATEDKSSIINTTPTPTPTSPRFQNQGHCQRSPRNNGNNNTNTIRVCSDCNTSTTPLWRSGPNGPKSLCNACGIRQRKARRAAMAEAANGLATTIDATSTKTTRVYNKEKKSRTNHYRQFKNKCKSTTTITCASSSHNHNGEKKHQYFKNFAISLKSNSAFQHVFPRDEVAEAALLLMDLSCGFVHF